MKRDWLFENVRVLKDDFAFADVSVAVRDGVIAGIGQPDGTGLQKIDATGMTLIPGLIDTHFHGALGNCFGRTGSEGIREVAAFEAGQGVTAIIPAVSATTDEFGKLWRPARAVHGWRASIWRVPSFRRNTGAGNG